uniref:Connectin n=1 Tax=Lutzomyia longipalpis TaxID=7200 RepID=A0A1B0CSF8_LUTLO
KISERAFDGLNNLKRLNLRHNRLVTLEKGIFIVVPALKSLYLNDNQLETLTYNNFLPIWDNLLKDDSVLGISAFDGLNNLKRLNLRHNRLVTLEKGIFIVVPALKSLYLNDNQLETLTYNNFLPIWDNLLKDDSVLGISDNRFTCDCRLLWIFELKNRTQNDELRRSLQDVECVLYDRNSVPEEIFTNAVKEKNDRVPGDYYDDAGYDNQDDTFVLDHRDVFDDGQKVQLLRFGAENLPCPEELSDPTEVPMSRESIGMVDMGLYSSASSWKLMAVSLFAMQTLIVAILC